MHDSTMKVTETKV